MTIDYDRLKAWPFDDIAQTSTPRDLMLYALGLGLGADPDDVAQLRYVYEEDLRVLPTFGFSLGHPGVWMKHPDAGVDWRRTLNGELDVQFLRPLPASGRTIARNRVHEIVDKGQGKGALLYMKREAFDADSKALLCSTMQTVFCRGDGGFGGPVRQSLPSSPAQVPDRAPDFSIDRKTFALIALIYRLSGDYHPIHADPKAAREAGLGKPILHGAATFGIACYAMVQALCDGEPERLRRLTCRFSAPVFPGETVRTDLWKTAPGTAVFRASALERGVTILTRGYAEYDSAT